MRRSASGSGNNAVSPKVEVTEDVNGAAGAAYEFVDDAGLADADAAVGNAEMLIKDEAN